MIICTVRVFESSCRYLFLLNAILALAVVKLKPPILGC